MLRRQNGKIAGLTPFTFIFWIAAYWIAAYRLLLIGSRGWLKAGEARSCFKPKRLLERKLHWRNSNYCLDGLGDCFLRDHFTGDARFFVAVTKNPGSGLRFCDSKSRRFRIAEMISDPNRIDKTQSQNPKPDPIEVASDAFMVARLTTFKTLG